GREETPAVRGGQDPPRRATAEKDYAAELPRFPMKDPGESLRAIVARAGFRVELVAAEPMLRSPVAIDFDEDGRLYVAEFPEYNQYATLDVGDAGDLRAAGGRGQETRAQPLAAG